jgi:hypothetical protein
MERKMKQKVNQNPDPCDIKVGQTYIFRLHLLEDDSGSDILDQLYEADGCLAIIERIIDLNSPCPLYLRVMSGPAKGIAFFAQLGEVYYFVPVKNSTPAERLKLGGLGI